MRYSAEGDMMLVFHFERRSPVPEESQAGFTRCADPVIPSMKTRNNNTQHDNIWWRMVLILGSDSIYWILFVSLHAEDFFSLFTNAAIFVKGNHDEAYEPSKPRRTKKRGGSRLFTPYGFGSYPLWRWKQVDGRFVDEIKRMIKQTWQLLWKWNGLFYFNDVRFVH